MQGLGWCCLKKCVLWLRRRLTKEELERRSKENLLSEVGGKALEAEEQVKILRQRINEMEEQMKKTEEVYKEQVCHFKYAHTKKYRTKTRTKCRFFIDRLKNRKTKHIQTGYVSYHLFHQKQCT